MQEEFYVPYNLVHDLSDLHQLVNQLLLFLSVFTSKRTKSCVLQGLEK